ncbi:MAG: glycosyltransferase family 2 protein [Bacteroidia bacterium]
MANSTYITMKRPEEMAVSTEITPAQTKAQVSNPPKPNMYIAILATWGLSLVWFHPRLIQLLYMADNPIRWASLVFFILFIEFAWLYGIYNLVLISFAWYYRKVHHNKEMNLVSMPAANAPGVALLHTVYNDFKPESALSCVNQDYHNFTVYILDDSTDPAYQMQVDSFASRFPHRVKVVRRDDRKAFKAGNMNNGLSTVATEEPYFAIADADEVLPPDFLAKLVPIMESDPMCAFIQANHRANPNADSKLAQAMAPGIDLHWKWYQPLRNRYGFVMFLGHGAILRRKCWEEIGGFPDIVSEDLGFAIRARELGYRGRFVEDVVCYEDFPETVRAFRVRHMKWTRGTCEFLYKEGLNLLRAERITWMEKMDILFPTLNLPLTLLFFLFMVNANLLLPFILGQSQPLTFAIAGQEFVIPIVSLQAGFGVIFTPDFYMITLLTFFAPVLCFIVGMWRTPLKLYRFLSHSTALYAALGPLSTVGVLSFLFTKKAIFLVTGDNFSQGKGLEKPRETVFQKIRNWGNELVGKSHPDQTAIQVFEIGIGVLFGVISIYLFQISFFGLCLAFILLPFMHHVTWNKPLVKALVFVPFTLILFGLGIGALGSLGMQTVFFGYGFHF